MKTKIVIISSSYYYEFISGIFQEQFPDCTVIHKEHRNLDHAVELYKEYKDDADGFMFYGNIGTAYIEQKIGAIKKPYISFQADTASFYKALLCLLVERRDLDPTRVILDFLVPVRKIATVECLVHNFDLAEIDSEIFDWWTTYSREEYSQVEMRAAERVFDLWNKNEIDMVICTFGGIISALQQNNIPYYFIYPTEEQLQDQIKRLLSQIELVKMHDNLPAAVALTCLSSEQSVECHQALKNAIVDIKNKIMPEAIIQQENDKLYVFSSCKRISVNTKKYSFCCFLTTLEEKYGFSASIGYGIGRTIPEAKANADNALKESLFSGGSYTIDEHRSLIGPMNSKRSLVVKSEISDFVRICSEKCHLSTIKVQKIVAVANLVESNKLATYDLVKHMGVSVRNADRILHKLENGGVAKVAYTCSNSPTGRPSKVYMIELE